MAGGNSVLGVSSPTLTHPKTGEGMEKEELAPLGRMASSFRIASISSIVEGSINVSDELAKSRPRPVHHGTFSLCIASRVHLYRPCTRSLDSGSVRTCGRRNPVRQINAALANSVNL